MGFRAHFLVFFGRRAAMIVRPPNWLGLGRIKLGLENERGGPWPPSGARPCCKTFAVELNKIGLRFVGRRPSDMVPICSGRFSTRVGTPETANPMALAAGQKVLAAGGVDFYALCVTAQHLGLGVTATDLDPFRDRRIITCVLNYAEDLEGTKRTTRPRPARILAQCRSTATARPSLCWRSSATSRDRHRVSSRQTAWMVDMFSQRIAPASASLRPPARLSKWSRSAQPSSFGYNWESPAKANRAATKPSVPVLVRYGRSMGRKYVR